MSYSESMRRNRTLTEQRLYESGRCICCGAKLKGMKDKDECKDCYRARCNYVFDHESNRAMVKLENNRAVAMNLGYNTRDGGGPEMNTDGDDK